MKRNRVISFILAIAVALSLDVLIGMSAFAASPFFSVMKGSETDDEVNVAVNIKNNSGFKGMGMSVDYDSSVLTPVDVSGGSALSSSMYVFSNIGSGSGLNITVGENSGSGSKSDGTVVNIKFKKAKNGTSTPISVVCDSDNTFGLDGTSELNISSGSSNVILSAKAKTTKRTSTTKKNVTKAPVTKKTVEKKTVQTVNPVKTPDNGNKPATTVRSSDLTAEEETTEIEEYISEEDYSEDDYSSYETTTHRTEYTTNAVSKKDGKKATFKIIAVVVIVVCAGAAAIIYVLSRRNYDEEF